jgi:four helix bundle protein
VNRETGDQENKAAKVIAMPKVKSHRDLLVWQQSMELVIMIYAITKQFPKEEQYGLTTQIRRAAVSMPSNITEGHARDYLKEYLQFLSMSLGSLAEVQTQLFIAKRLAYIPDQAFADAEDLADKTFKMIKNLQRNLKEKL